jgi:hypothetical protein
MKSYSVLKSNVGSFIQDTSSSLESLIGIWINNRYKDVVNSYDWEQLYHNQTFASTANRSSYPMDENTDRLIFVKDRTNQSYTEVITEQDFLENYYDDLDTTGQPEVCYLTSSPVTTQPASAEKLTLKSSSASDITPTVLIRGITSTGGETYETLTLTGTTAVTASNTYSKVLGISKSQATIGKITVYENDESTIKAELSPETLVSRYKSINFHPIPAETVTYQIRSRRRITPLSQDYDYPMIEDIDDIIELGAQADAWRYKRQFAKSTSLETQYQVLKMERIHQEVAQPGIIHQFQPMALDRDEGIL